jgi:Sulfotransferase family
MSSGMPKIRIFIIPRGRTGGSLLATMLNAHRRISMGYELYPDKLSDERGEPYTIEDLIRRLDDAEARDPKRGLSGLKRDNFRIFCARARRSDIQPMALLALLRSFRAAGRTLASLDDQLDLIDSMLIYQANAAGKPIVGSKMRVEPQTLHRRHPHACFLMMLRDGRDVLASRLHVGNFRQSPTQVAREWSEALADFERFLQQSGAIGQLVRYEALVSKPTTSLMQIVGLVGLEFDPNMVEFEKQDQALFRHPHGQLSAHQLESGLSDASIGRWMRDLTSAQLDEFLQIAGPTLKRFGYA